VKTQPFPRFDRTERVVHWTNATLFFVLIGTGATLRIPSLAVAVGRRDLVKTLHVYSGYLLPVPVLAALVLRAGRQFRRDLGRLNRWSADDWRWWSRRRRADAQLGKFNPGQKLNAVFIAAAIVVMLVSGLMLRFPDHPYHLSNSLRRGATFVHDWTFVVLCVVILGHIWFAVRDPDSLRSMVRGWVPETWARRERPRWWAEISGASGDARRDVETGSEQGLSKTRAGTGEVAVGDGVDGRASDGTGGGHL
jgi:formate dehydrogenase subunit gamma